MPNVSQSTTDPKVASQEPQNASAAQSQQNKGEGGSSKQQIEALFRAARERNAELTPEQIHKQYPWSAHPPKSVNSDVAAAVLEELEAPAEDSDDAGDGEATGAGAEEASTKTKG
ncbi:hypothetical protein SLS64_000143 [Diaporthe eres]|uniref:Uncharacterized protein n=1 Tax=Diaporthe eres TaxID=83184 RepID=A0ABR1P5C2_DIAER